MWPDGDQFRIESLNDLLFEVGDDEWSNPEQVGGEIKDCRDDVESHSDLTWQKYPNVKEMSGRKTPKLRLPPLSHVWSDSDCGTVGKSEATDTRGSGFKSRHLQPFINF